MSQLLGFTVTHQEQHLASWMGLGNHRGQYLAMFDTFHQAQHPLYRRLIEHVRQGRRLPDLPIGEDRLLGTRCLGLDWRGGRQRHQPLLRRRQASYIMAGGQPVALTTERIARQAQALRLTLIGGPPIHGVACGPVLDMGVQDLLRPGRRVDRGRQ
ncbi:hypothetical protein D3C84_276840 [compost metagenome]